MNAKTLRVLPTVIVSFLTTQAWAGNLTVAGDFNVASNFTSQSAVTTNLTFRFGTVGDGGHYVSGLYRTNDVGQGIFIHRQDDTAYLNMIEGWGGRAAMQAYSDTNKSPTELSLNVNGGQVSFGMIYGSTGFDVKTNAEFHSHVTIDGALHVAGGMDPPYILYETETRTSVAQRAAREVPPDKQTGAALFFNQATKRLEVYIAAEGTFYDLAGNVIASQPPPAAQVTVGRRIWFDSETGEVVTNQTVDAQRYQIGQGYEFDPTDGHFYQISSGANSNTVPRVLVPKSQAITLTPESSETPITNTGTADAN